MGTQGKGFGVLGIELADDFGPEHTGGTHLGYFHEVVHAHAPEEAETGSKVVDAHAGLENLKIALGQVVGCRTVDEHGIERAGVAHVVQDVLKVGQCRIACHDIVSVGELDEVLFLVIEKNSFSDFILRCAIWYDEDI